MAKQFQVCVLLVILGLALTCRATLYNVGDSSGWDVSSDLDTWKQGKTFVVGDVLGEYFVYISHMENISIATKLVRQRDLPNNPDEFSCFNSVVACMIASFKMLLNVFDLSNFFLLRERAGRVVVNVNVRRQKNCILISW